MSAPTLMHITSYEAWQAAQATGLYRGDTLDSEGFIHCSTPEQTVATANRFFHGQTGLLLLTIEADKVSAPIKYEAADGELFPHIYGPLNVEAVIAVHPFEPNTDDSFSLPE